MVVVAVARAGCHKGSQRGVGGCLVGCLKVLEGDALELERAEAEARLARHVDDDTERHLGFLRQGEADAAVAEHVPGEGFRFAVGIAHELRAVVHDDAAGLRGGAVAEGTREGVAPCGQADGLPEAVVVQLVGKVAPDGLDGDVVAMRGIDVGACDDVAVLDLVQLAPGAALGAHLEAQEAAAVSGVDGARGGVVGTLVVGEVRRRDVACGGCVEVEGEDAEGRVPGIAVGAEVDARGIEGVRRTVGDVAPALVEVVIDAQGVSGFGSSHVRDGGVAVAAQGVGAEGAVPEAELVQQAVEAAVGAAYGKVVPGRGAGAELVCGRSEQDAVAPELHGAGVVDEGVVVPLAQHDVALARGDRLAAEGDTDAAIVGADGAEGLGCERGAARVGRGAHPPVEGEARSALGNGAGELDVLDAREVESRPGIGVTYGEQASLGGLAATLGVADVEGDVVDARRNGDDSGAPAADGEAAVSVGEFPRPGGRLVAALVVQPDGVAQQDGSRCDVEQGSRGCGADGNLATDGRRAVGVRCCECHAEGAQRGVEGRGVGGCQPLHFGSRQRPDVGAALALGAVDEAETVSRRQHVGFGIEGCHRGKAIGNGNLGGVGGCLTVEERGCEGDVVDARLPEEERGVLSADVGRVGPFGVPRPGGSIH